MTSFLTSTTFYHKRSVKSNFCSLTQLTRNNVRVIVKMTWEVCDMLEVIKSKSMIVVMILVLGVAYFSAAQTTNLNDGYNSNSIIINNMN